MPSMIWEFTRRSRYGSVGTRDPLRRHAPVWLSSERVPPPPMANMWRESSPRNWQLRASPSSLERRSVSTPQLTARPSPVAVTQSP